MKNNKVLIQHDDMFLLAEDQPSNRLKKLPAGTYLMSIAPEIGYYLKSVSDFDLPEKLYGDIEEKANRILNTFHDRPRTTGVLLSGEKGSGKTLLTKYISSLGQKRGLPTIIINNDFSGDGFNLFLQGIGDCILLFDEFEKIYDKDSQQGLLTLLDGIFTTKKLILLTTNNYLGINDHLQNRPGRIYYNLQFDGLDSNFIMEYGQEKLKNKAYLSNLGVVASMVKPVSFDILQAIIEESNRYGESPVKALEMLNVKVASSYVEEFTTKVVNKKDAKNPFIKLYGDEDDNKILRVNPFKQFCMNYITPCKKSKSNPKGEQYHTAYIDPTIMKSFDGLKGTFTYENDDFALSLTRVPFDKRSGFTKYEHLAVDVSGEEIYD
jgi:hypothetical protein